MAREHNFLLGHGERLTEKVDVPSGGGPKNPPYDFEAARRRVAAKLSSVNMELRAVPSAACPNDQVVAVLTMHPVEFEAMLPEQIDMWEIYGRVLTLAIFVGKQPPCTA